MIRRDCVLEILSEILEIPSPTGYTKEIMVHISQLLSESGIKRFYTNIPYYGSDGSPALRACSPQRS